MVERIRHKARNERGLENNRPLSIADLIIYTTLEGFDGICKDVFASLEDELVRKLVERVRSRKVENGDMSAWTLSRGFCLLGKQTKRKKTREGYKRTRTQGCPIGYDRKRAEKSSILSAFTSPVSLMRAEGETPRPPARRQSGGELSHVPKGGLEPPHGVKPYPVKRDKLDFESSLPRRHSGRVYSLSYSD
jgi:hypothetical protein